MVLFCECPAFQAKGPTLQRRVARSSPTHEEVRLYMGFFATEPVFGISDKVRLKPVSSATETS